MLRRIKKTLLHLTKPLLLIIFLPFALFNKKFKPLSTIGLLKKRVLFRHIKKSFTFKALFLKLIWLFITIFFLLPIWLVGYIVVGFIIFYLIMQSGLVGYDIPVSGTSMLPTIHDGEKVRAYAYNNVLSNFEKISRGDVVVFNNSKTMDDKGEKVSLIKRTIAVAGDKVKIEDGFVFVNNQLIEEPYIAKARSTFGGSFIEECKTIDIPPGDILVLGDNRKKSKDSREIGLVKISDISSILPRSKQNDYESRWREASNDKTQAGVTSFDLNSYYDKLNKMRAGRGLKPLKRNEKLEEAAKIRATTIIDFDERKVSPDQSHLPPAKAYQQAGYYNIITGETSTTGYYDAEELTNYWLEFNTKDTVLNKDYQETGIASVVGKINGCETQVIVQEFGGYVPPNYEQADIDSWKTVLSNLKEIQPNWKKLEESGEFYKNNQKDADRINEIIATRISNIEAIIKRMEANQWLTTQEKGYVDGDKNLYDDQESLATKLNGG